MGRPRIVVAVLAAGGVLWACTGEDGPAGPTTGPDGHLASIEVTTRAVGTDLDLDGFRLVVDGRPLGHSLLDTTLTVEVEPGDREVLLADVAGNCEVGGANPRLIASTSEDTVRTDFRVTCRLLPSLSGEIVAAVWHHPVAASDVFHRGLFIVDDTDGSLQRLTAAPEGVRDNQPAVAPDGKRIAVARDHEFGQVGPADVRVHLVHADGSEEPGSLSTGMAWGAMPAWSPDGGRLAFSGAMAGETGRSIYVVEVAGTGLIRLTSNGCFDTAPAWSPDGEWIAYRSCELGPGLHAVRPDGSEIRRLTTPESDHDFDPSWSPDGSRVAFTSNRSGAWRVYLVDAAGGTPRPLTPDSGEHHDFGGRWSGDGEWFLFKREEPAIGNPTNTEIELWLIRPDGTGLRQLTDNESLDEHAFDWAR